ncbi:rhomboid family intramembrane serine protease [Methylopila turkensis]|uniref:Peptidase S54 rhomboid domain-containing protein n=1 Tax=Methylopila turkensis TaxID=1437816 RepID=A0A9W6JPD9_9HYPH|nr:rhomboid family intramembrane serine protease [Methylopila turkensis]GLK81346.1 hypothetical protein GCM10008174_30870 [Methylopila turkensis]
MERQREPIFNIPLSVSAPIALFVAIHLVRLALSDEQDLWLLLHAAFIPARYDAASPYAAEFAAAGGDAAGVWTFLSYAFLHGDYMHLIVNSVWMLAFGSAVAWRFGAVRFLLFSAICAIAGAATHLAVHFGDPIPVIGASAAISGHMAAALRFVFAATGPLGVFRPHGREAFFAPAASLRQTLRLPQAIVFLAVWFGSNIIFGLGAMTLVGEGASVAWEAHIGGFVAGLLLFPLIDPKVARFDRVSQGDAGLRLPPEGPHDDGDGAPGRP